MKQDEQDQQKMEINFISPLAAMQKMLMEFPPTTVDERTKTPESRLICKHCKFEFPSNWYRRIHESTCKMIFGKNQLEYLRYVLFLFKIFLLFENTNKIKNTFCWLICMTITYNTQASTKSLFMIFLRLNFKILLSFHSSLFTYEFLIFIYLLILKYIKNYFFRLNHFPCINKNIIFQENNDKAVNLRWMRDRLYSKKKLSQPTFQSPDLPLIKIITFKKFHYFN